MNIWVTWNPGPSTGPEQPVTCFSPHPAPRPDPRGLDPNAIQVPVDTKDFTWACVKEVTEKTN